MHYHARVFVISVLFLSACATTSDPTSSPLWKEIKAVNEALEERMRQNDLEGVAGFYSDDAILIGPGGFRVEGREEIDKYWAGFGQGIDWQLEIHDVGGEEGLVYQRGTSHLTYEREGETRTSTVEFVLLWERQPNGTYLVKVDAYW